MTAKLYRVRIAEFNCNFTKVWTREAWIAATSPRQARGRALQHYSLGENNPNVHCTVTCERGGVYREPTRFMQVAT